MKRLIYIFVIFIFSTACSREKLSNSIIGEWRWGERTISISEGHVVFNNNSEDYLRYELLPDSMVAFYVEEGEGWSGKIKYISRNKIIFFDMIFNVAATFL